MVGGGLEGGGGGIVFRWDEKRNSGRCAVAWIVGGKGWKGLVGVCYGAIGGNYR